MAGGKEGQDQMYTVTQSLDKYLFPRTLFTLNPLNAPSRNKNKPSFILPPLKTSIISYPFLLSIQLPPPRTTNTSPSFTNTHRLGRRYLVPISQQASTQ
jgi:hypothetical protein